jgi:hypothetical protein
MSVDQLISTIDSQLKRFGRQRAGLDLREKVLQLVEIYANVKDLGINAVAESGIDAAGAPERIRLYLVQYHGVVVDGAELEVVSGISEYGRRIRELRVEEGYQIASGASPDPESGISLKPDQYMLVSPEPDQNAARRWHVANRIRKSSHGSQHRVLQFLLENVGQVVTTEELAYVAKDAHEFGRRTRELRTEKGYAVATRFTGRPDLGPGQYVLQSKDRIAEPHDRRIPEEVLKVVYKRDENKCRVCGWRIEKWKRDDPRILELHHLEEHVAKGKNVAKNLIVICSRCHDEVHAGKHSATITKIKQHL